MPGCPQGACTRDAHALRLAEERWPPAGADSSFARSLNGTWKFHYVPHPDLRPLDFYKPESDV